MRTVVSAFFSALARVRNAPAVHPRRLGFTGQLVVSGVNAVLPKGTYPVTAQLSKGAGMPGRWPDVLGIALRLQPGQTSWDFLFSSGGRGRLSRWIPVPAPDWNVARYGTLGPYEVAGHNWWLMLTPDGRRTGHASVDALHKRAPSTFTLSISGERPRWVRIGELELFSPSTDVVSFDPVLNHPDHAVPGPPWLRRLRELAYQGSRRGRRNAD
jgi:hypothetical protein